MSTTKDGGTAFPVISSTGDPRDGVYFRECMSLRDYFAANERLDDLMQADGRVLEKLVQELGGTPPDGRWRDNPVEMLKWEAKWRAAIRYIRADAMLAAREKAGGAS